ncbi:MAG: hypothetical protein EOM92_14365, partial [Gammaproteobacteria bacterium]|nr:hypothetical protein [Gammaproteobacteria bacterium]
MSLVLAGPLLRRIEARRLVLWLATSQVARLRLELRSGEDWIASHEIDPGTPACRHLAAGQHLHYLLVDVRLTVSLPMGRWIDYRLLLAPLATGGEQVAASGWAAADWHDASRWAPDLCYPGRTSPGFVFLPRVATLLHGSCRKPHYPSGDGLAAADDLLAALVAAGGRDGAAVPGDQGATAEGKPSAGDCREGVGHSPGHASPCHSLPAYPHETALHAADNERPSGDLPAQERNLDTLMAGNPGTRGLA